MVKKFSQGNRIVYAISKWLCDDVEDIPKIPKSPMGSTVFVIHTKDTYMADSQGVWYSITSDAASVEPCDCVDELTIWGDIPIVTE